jgi:hypothetical protein
VKEACHCNMKVLDSADQPSYSRPDQHTAQLT